MRLSGCASWLSCMDGNFLKFCFIAAFTTVAISLKTAFIYDRITIKMKKWENSAMSALDI